jgi:hypothetical protein
MEKAKPLTLDDLDLGDADHPGEDRICIVRAHADGTISWRFATPKADPMGMLARVVWFQMMHESGYHERIEKLEKRVDELEALLGQDKQQLR